MTPRVTAWMGAATAVWIVIVLATAPPVPYAWDAAATWIDRAEAERHRPGALLTMMTQPGDWPLLMTITGIHTYPIGHAMITGAIARIALPVDVSARRAADLWLGFVLLTLLWRVSRKTRRSPTASPWIAPMVFLTPLVVVHLRVGYVDVLVGALGALSTLAVVDALRNPTPGRWAQWAAVATLICQTKQDGAVILTASIIVSMAIVRPWSRRSRVWAWLPLAVMILNVGGWWMLMRALFGDDMPPAYRTFTGVEVTRIVPFAHAAVQHALDPDSWAVTWPVLAGAAIARRDLWWPTFVLLSLGIYAALHVVGPPEMMQYLATGTVMNRLLIQVLVASLPLAAAPYHDAMPTIWDPATRRSLEARVDCLTTSSTASWGRLHVAGMLAHLNDSTRMALGEIPVATIWLPIRYPPLRQLVVYLLPIPKSAPTAPELIARVESADLEAERAAFRACMARLGEVTSGGQLVPHPAFGHLSFKEYGVLIAKHTDHHLRQFGV